jgi:hypothetical protein
MNHKVFSSTARRSPTYLRFLVVCVVAVALAPAAQSQVKLQQLSSDTFNNGGSEHATEVGPDSFSFGSTIVTAFQVGRNFSSGSTDVGFSTSSDGGNTWHNGYLPGITQFYQGGQYLAVTDPSVVFDAMHGVWMITSLGVGLFSNDVLVSLSNDGITWGNPVVVDSSSLFADKPWITCDNNNKQYYYHYGHCYVSWDDAGQADEMRMSTSADGGQKWSSAYTLPTGFGLGGQPVVGTKGIATVPFLGSGMQFFYSTNGGKTWGNVGKISSVTTHQVSGGLRVTGGLPSAAVDGTNKVYVVWQDCRFRSNCSSNDIVMSTSSDGQKWSAVTRIPIDATDSTVDHFIPGLAVDPSTSGKSAHLALTYYYYPVANCTPKTCNLSVGYVSSQDGGQTWTTSQELTGGMKVTWLPTTLLGYMVGDYISTSYVQGKAYGVFAVATKPGSKYHQAMFAPVGGLMESENGPFFSSAGDYPVPNAKSDHGSRPYWDSDGRLPKRRVTRQ